MKFQRNRSNINVVLGIQNSLSHILWPLFEDEKDDRVEIGCFNFFIKSRVALKLLLP